MWSRALMACLLAISTVPAAAYHYPWDQGHDTTTSVDPPKPGPEDKSCADPDITCSATRSPVYAANGQAVWRAVDVQLFGRPYMGVYRVYNSNDPVVGLFGNGWAVDFDVALYPVTAGNSVQRIYKAANGKRFVYVKQADGSFRTPEGRFDTVVETGTTATMTMLDGQRYVFAADGRLLQRIDANGNVVAFGYDASLRPISISDGNSRFIGLMYNAQSLVSTVTDHSGRAWRYAYDALGNLSSVTDPAAGVTRYTWQAYKPAGDAQTYSQLLSATDPSGVVSVSFTYSGNQVSSYTEGANRISYTRPYTNTSSGGTVAQSDSMGATSSFDYGPLGLVIRDTDGMGGVTRYAYDANGRTTQTTDALGRVWASTYDSLGRMTSISNALPQTTTWQFSGNSPYPVRMVSPTGRVTTMTYDSRGGLLTRTDPSGAVTRMSYDARGNLTTVINALSQQTSIEYSSTSLPIRVTDALGRQATMSYDGLGRMTVATNAAGEATTYRYDALDRTVAIVDPLNQTTAMTYDGAGRLTSLTDAKGSTVRYEYDSFGRRSADVAPDGRRTTFGYRSDNLLSLITWPDSTRLSFDYDANKRRTRETAGSETITYAYNAVDQLTSTTGSGGTVSYSYDNVDRVLTETSGGRTSTIVRNAEGERARIDYLGQSLVYSRDARGQIARIGAPVGNFDFVHDALQRRTQLSYPNGSTVRSTFDAAGQLTGLAHAGALNAPYTHAFDAAGRLTRLTGSGADWNYTYDTIGRLTRATQAASSTVYSMDAVANLLGSGRTYDANHRLTSDSAKTYSYDLRGNLTLESDRASGARVVYAWNARNQLTRMDVYPNASTTVATRTLQYTYDPLGRRASKTDNGVVQRFVHDGDDVIGVLDGSNNIVAVNLFGEEIDEPLSTTTGGSNRLMYADHLGSIMAVGTGATVTHSYRYGPYGETLSGSSTDSTPFRFTAREKDTDSLYYYRSRYYSTAMQRFISLDSIGLAGGVNPYAYVEADPINRTDPRGEQGPVGAAVGAVGEVLVQIGGGWYGGKTFVDAVKGVEIKHVLAQGAIGFVLPGPLTKGASAVKGGAQALWAWLGYQETRALVYLNRGAIAGHATQIAVTCKWAAKKATDWIMPNGPTLGSVAGALPDSGPRPSAVQQYESGASYGRGGGKFMKD